MKLKSILAILLCLPLLGCAGARNGLNRYAGSFLDVFDTVTQVVVYEADEEAANARIQAIHDELTVYHRLYDIYNAYEGMNNLYTVNQNAGIGPVAVDERILDLMDFAVEMYDLSDGLVNVAMGSVLSLWHEYREAGTADPANAALPPMDALRAAADHTDINDVILDRAAGTLYLSDPQMRLDVGAIAKGYAGKRVIEGMKAQGIPSLLLSLGGNVCALGGRGDGKDWKIGVQAPDMAHYLCYVAVNDGNLVTSGAYQRYYTVDGRQYHHIIDPETLMPADYFDSVTVLCGDSGLADAMSTALFLMPLAQGQALVASTENLEAMWLDRDGQIAYSAGFEAHLTAN